MSKLLKKRIILLRHGVTRENTLEIIQGQTVSGELVDSKISLGLVRWCARRIKPPAVVASSDTKRAADFAKGLSKALEVPLRKSFLLRQRRWGHVEGKRISEIGDIYAANPFYEDFNVLARGAESLHDVIDRARQAIKYLHSINVKTVVVVTHDEFSNYLINEILNEGLFRRPLTYNEAHVIDYLKDGGIEEQLHVGTFTLSKRLVNRYIVVRKDAPTFLSNPVGVRILRNRGIKVISNNEKTDKELVEGIVIGDDYFTENDLREYPNLKVIARFGKGYSNVQIKRRKGLFLANTADCNTEAVAEFTVAIILNLIKNISTTVSEARRKTANIIRPFSKEYSEATVGVVGMGPIGKSVTQLLKKLGFNILVWTKRPEKYKGYIRDNNVKIASSLEELFKKSDIVSLHIRLCDETRKIIRMNELRLMSAHRGCLVNTSRIELIDCRALLKALERKWVRAAAIDVSPKLAGIAGENRMIMTKLLHHEGVILTPHIAGRTYRAVEKSVALTAYNIGWIFSGRSEKASVVEL